MPIVQIDSDELYPYYYMSEIKKGDFVYGKKVKVSKKFLKQYNKASETFWKLHEKLSEIYDKGRL